MWHIQPKRAMESPPIKQRYAFHAAVHALSPVWSSVTSRTAACQAPMYSTILQSQLKFMSIELVMLADRLILCHPLLVPSIFPSIGVFSNESVFCIRWPKEQSFSFSNSPSNDYSELIPFRIDWFDLLAVNGLSKSLFSGTTIWNQEFFSAQPSLWSNSHSCTTTGKKHSFGYKDLCQQSDVSAF